LRIEHAPHFPDGYRPGIGIVGCGDVVRRGHLPAYEKYGCRVVGVHDVSTEAARVAGVPVFETFDHLLSQPDVEIIDIATPPETRAPLIEAAVDAGKHVLSQKPLALDLATARRLVETAERRGMRLAVNQNARWAPAWRVATLLREDGAVGSVFAVTHLLEKRFDFVLDSPRLDAMRHFLLFDYCIHWIDISRCWLDGSSPTSVSAVERRTAGQPERSRSAWGATVTIQCADGASAAIHSTGGSASPPRCRFSIHGTNGTIRGGILHGDDHVELRRATGATRFELEGEWWPDGFGGAMAELQSAIVEDREPANSARDNLATLELTLAACRSAEAEGRPVRIEAAGTPSARS
jgi:predicted dehydrogenase